MQLLIHNLLLSNQSISTVLHIDDLSMLCIYQFTILSGLTLLPQD